MRDWLGAGALRGHAGVIRVDSASQSNGRGGGVYPAPAPNQPQNAKSASIKKRIVRWEIQRVRCADFSAALTHQLYRVFIHTRSMPCGFHAPFINVGIS